MNLKAIIKKSFQSFGYDIIRYVPDVIHPFDVLPLLVRERLAENKNFFFVQVGANDGIHDDPLRKLVLEHHLAGLLVEPLPDFFDKLVANYSDCPGLIFENVAIGDKPGKIPIYRVKRDADVPKYWHSMASFSKAHLINEGIGEHLIESLNVSVATIPDLFSRHRIKDIDLLQVDTEGFDFVIIKAVLDAGFLPHIINYEHCHLPPHVQFACKTLLKECGYRFIDVGKDTVAVLEKR